MYKEIDFMDSCDEAKKTSELVFIIVDYNLQGLVNNAVDSIYNCGHSFRKIVIVDNYGSEKEYKHEHEEYVDILRPGVNLGFGGGCNYGWERVTKTANLLICFVNPDAIVVPNGVSDCIRFLERNQEIPAVSGLIVHSGFDGHEFTSGAYYLSKYCGFVRMDKGAKDNSQLVSTSYLGGSCFFIRSSAFEQVGGFDIDYFLYWEEVDLFLRLAKTYPSAIVLPRVVAKHVGGASVGKEGDSPLRVGFKSRNFLKLTAEHSGYYKCIWILKWLIVDSMLLVKNSGLTSAKLHLRMIKYRNMSGQKLSELLNLKSEL